MVFWNFLTFQKKFVKFFFLCKIMKFDIFWKFFIKLGQKNKNQAFHFAGNRLYFTLRFSLLMLIDTSRILQQVSLSIDYPDMKLILPLPSIVTEELPVSLNNDFPHLWQLPLMLDSTLQSLHFIINYWWNFNLLNF